MNERDERVSVATIGDAIRADLMRHIRDELTAMVRRVADRERDRAVAARLREIADAFQSARV